MHGFYAKYGVAGIMRIAFVANLIFVANTRFFGLFCPDFYSDI